MKFRILFSSSWTVKHASNAEAGWRLDPGKGVWWLKLGRIEQLVSEAISTLSFGESIDTYAFGLEILDTSEGFGFEDTRDYVSYRPKMRLLLSVGQVDWPDVRFLSPAAQWDVFKQSLLDSIHRAATTKRKPRDFNLEAFHTTLTRVLEGLNPQDFTASMDIA
jgi:hypothetical protein